MKYYYLENKENHEFAIIEEKNLEYIKPIVDVDPRFELTEISEKEAHFHIRSMAHPM